MGPDARDHRLTGVELIGDTFAFLTDPANWDGPNGIGVRLWEQIVLSAASLGAALAIALPAGLAIGHTGRGARAVVSLANIGRAVPTLGLIGIFFPIVLALRTGESGFWTSLLALVLLAIPPIVTNTYVGLREVDRDLIEAGRGMGMRERELLFGVEVPLALPVILAGVRTSAVQTVATSTLAAVVSGGTLGILIIQGINGGDRARLVGAALLVAVLSILTELLFALIQHRGTRRQRARPFAEGGQAPRPPGI